MKPFAFVFPGQGSQSVGMLDAWGDHPAVRATLDEASQALGEDLARLVREGPKEALDLTSKALDSEPNYVLESYQKEQLWGPKLRRITQELLLLPDLKPVVDRALANASPEGESSEGE
jgi:malonyl CoA-acyl carrier protein transacylase